MGNHTATRARGRATGGNGVHTPTYTEYEQAREAHTTTLYDPARYARAGSPERAAYEKREAETRQRAAALAEARDTAWTRRGNTSPGLERFRAEVAARAASNRTSAREGGSRDSLVPMMRAELRRYESGDLGPPKEPPAKPNESLTATRDRLNKWSNAFSIWLNPGPGAERLDKATSDLQYTIHQRLNAARQAVIDAAHARQPGIAALQRSIAGARNVLAASHAFQTAAPKARGTNSGITALWKELEQYHDSHQIARPTAAQLKRLSTWDRTFATWLHETPGTQKYNAAMLALQEQIMAARPVARTAKSA